MKNLEELKNNDKIKEILDTTKIIKSQRQPQNLKRLLTSLHPEKTHHNELPNAIINDAKYDIIVEGKSYSFKNPETEFKINKNLSCNSKNIVYIMERSECKEIYLGST